MPFTEFGPIKYSIRSAPNTYCCSKCGAKGVKLYRQYMVPIIETQLACTHCATQDLIPAIPTEDGVTFWPHAKASLDAELWWATLP